MRSSVPVLIGALISFGCPEKIGVGNADSGAADADVRDADPSDADPLDADPLDGASMDASDSNDAGTDDAGVPREPLRFGTMDLPANQRSPTTIWGRSTAELYVGTASGDVLAFSPANGWQVAWHEPSNFGIARIRGTAQRIFVASTGSLHVHGAALGENVSSFYVGSFVRDLEVVSDDEAYVVSDLTTGRAVFRYDGADVTVLNDQLDAAVLYGLFADEDGTLFVAANGKIFRYASFTWSADPIEWPSDFDISDIANFDLYDIARVGSDLFAVGDEHHVLKWDGGTWRFVYEPNHGQFLGAIGALSDVEAYAVGRNGAGGPIARFAGGSWSHVGYSSNHNFFDLWIAGPNELFAAGVVGSTFDPVILRGYR